MVRISASPHPTFNYVQVDDSLGDIGASPSPIHIQAIAVGVMYLGCHQLGSLFVTDT